LEGAITKQGVWFDLSQRAGGVENDRKSKEGGRDSDRNNRFKPQWSWVGKKARRKRPYSKGNKRGVAPWDCRKTERVQNGVTFKKKRNPNQKATA